MAQETTDRELRIISGHGRDANDREEPLNSNPHAPETLEYDAWLAGWYEAEGPTYFITALAKQHYRRATLADIWPK